MRHCFLPMLAWFLLRVCLRVKCPDQTLRVPPRAKRVSVRVENTMTWTMSAIQHVTIPFLRCWVTFPLGIILKKMPSLMRGNLSLRYLNCLKKNSGSRCMRVMMKPKPFGKSTLMPVALCVLAIKITFGRWAIRVLVALVVKFSSTKGRRILTRQKITWEAMATVS